MKAAPGAVRRVAHPVLMDYVRHGRSCVLVNLAATPHIDYLQCWQLGGVPCNNPDCIGEGGRWNTVPVRWASVHNQHEIFVDEYGAPNPLDYVKMRCLTCHPASQNTYSPLDPVVLKRLPDYVRNKLPWDWRWPFGEIKLHSVCYLPTFLPFLPTSRIGLNTPNEHSRVHTT